MRFRTTLEQAGKTATGFEVPSTVVEGLGAGKRPAVRVTINGFTYRSTVAVMGSDCSEEQATLIFGRVDFDGRIWIMSDGDEGGGQRQPNLIVPGEHGLRVRRTSGLRAAA